jgi:Asp/Glu/hydantoin racemase
MSVENPSNAVVLVCAGMTKIWNKLQSDHQVTLIDLVAVAAKIIPMIA